MHLWDQWIRNKLIELVKKRQTFEEWTSIKILKKVEKINYKCLT